MKTHFLKTKQSVTGLFLGLVLAVSGFSANTWAQTNQTNPLEAILQSPGFGRSLVWVGDSEPARDESLELLEILNQLDQPTWTSATEQFLKNHSSSPWSASLHLAYASFCRETGRTSKALEHWESGWALVKEDAGAKGKNLGNEILNGWMSQLSSLGRVETLNELVAVGEKRNFSSNQHREQFFAAKDALYRMQLHPGISYRCGTFALKSVGLRLQAGAASLESLVGEPSPTNGFSVGDLLGFAEQKGLKLVAVRRNAGATLVTPSVVHWRQNHYAAILDKMDDLYLVDDPTSGNPKWYPSAVILEEASGVFLIPADKQTADWKTLTQAEANTIRGKGLPNNTNDKKDKGCPPGKKCPPCPGMPVWWVSEPHLNLWIADEPLSYLTSRGEPFTFRMSYKQRDTRPAGGSIPVNSWNHNWSSFVNLASTQPCLVAGGCPPPGALLEATLYLAGGGEVFFNGANQYYDKETGLSLGLAAQTMKAGQDYGDNGVRVLHADGSQDIYGWLIGNTTPYNGYGKSTCALTRRIDPHGNTTRFSYESGSFGYRLKSVVDYDGRTNTLSYGANGMLASVTNAYGKFALFGYDANYNLTSITDAIGMVSTLTYDTNNYPSRLITPYGTNTLEVIQNAEVGQGNSGGHNLISRAVRATDPTGATQLYAYRYDCSSIMAANIPTNEVPVGTPFGTLDTGSGGTNSFSAFSFRNSFHWNPRQYAALSTTALTNFTANDYLRGRLRHWLQDTNDLFLSGQISVEREASHDGSTEGLKRFYDYPGKIYPHRASVGTDFKPAVTAWRLPGGETHYEYLRYNEWGNVTNWVTTYSKADGTLGTRTNQYLYAYNTYTNAFGGFQGGVVVFGGTNFYTIPNLLIQEIGADSQLVWQAGGFETVVWTNDFKEGLNITNRILQLSKRVLPRYVTNAVGEISTNFFVGKNLLSGVNHSTGLTTTNLYDSAGFWTRMIDIETGRTNSFGYGDLGLVQYHTNDLGVVTTNTWDNLLRLTSSADSRGYVSNRFDKLNLIAERDRLGNWRNYGYDRAQRLTAFTNELNQTTRLSWCGCGTLESFTNAIGEVTSFAYDQQSRLNTITFSPTIYLNRSYDLSGRLLNVSDSAGVSVNLGHNHQGLLTSATNAFGEIYRAVFDVRDRPVWSKSSAGVWTTNTFDGLDRVLTRQIAIGNAERFGYGPAGLVAYTNQIDEITRWVFDAGARLLRQTNFNQEVLQFVHDPANNLTNLLDGKSQRTAWQFDAFSRMTNKLDDLNNPVLRLAYDANDRATNRWTPAKGNAGFVRDAVGNLLSINYPLSTINLLYDPLNRLTNMTDAVGTHRFTYSRMGALASEDGPWAEDTVSHVFGLAHQLTNTTILRPGMADWVQTFRYDAAGRMTNTASPAGAFAYAYLGASDLITKLTLGSAGTITNAYDLVARLLSTSLKTSGGVVRNSHTYGYDLASRRTTQTNTVGDYRNFTYDGISQLTTALGYEANGSPRLNEQQGYAYDAAGSLRYRTNNALVQTFNTDTLNQLSTINRSGTLTVAGNTTAAATNVTVNALTATRYADKTWAKDGFTITNGNNSFTAIARNNVGVAATNQITVNLPATNNFVYDLNGNLLSDGLHGLDYDDENQMIRVTVTNQFKKEFVYDGVNRLRIKREFSWSGSAWVKTNETRLVCDGMLPIQHRDANNIPKLTLTRGLDLSGSIHGAGGIGGLLAMTEASGAHSYYHNDGNGNVTTLIDASQLVVARRSYDSFGNTLSLSGTKASVNPYWFSSEMWDNDTGFLHYPRRVYIPNLQRWLTRDPIGERGGINLYQFVGNTPLNAVDPLGLEIGTYNASLGDGHIAPGPFTYLTGDTTGEQIGAGLYNSLPLVYNTGYSMLDSMMQAGKGFADFMGWGAGQLGAGSGDQALVATFVGAAIDTMPFPKVGKVPCVRPTELYALRAVEDGFYPVMKRKFKEPQGGIWLNKGDVWKYGTTMNPKTRYSKSFLDKWGLDYNPLSSGTLSSALAGEYTSLVLHLEANGVLPPGNKILR